MTSRDTFPTQNPAWSSRGSMTEYADPAVAWPIAMASIADATGCDDEEVRAFLDSRHGRHFADDVANELITGLGLDAAIAAATARWMAWRIGARTSRETGIPRGLPYLTGHVIHDGIVAD